ncbi:MULTISPECIES: Nramp family divalent metal transporter [unclassified Methylobacterium]|jgi:manganese transport protein|uniref:Nramp family divalent metal transporter n=1 Tax=unclassified Methylobacterium TaxID=2615210 RepID=UPI0013548DFA|nr:Nramp family divalent metal transporter [Methylobacterium sp. 2A]MWV24784.1 divalent metal cation transporter [Methylobacterium sp. 2A]
MVAPNAATAPVRAAPGAMSRRTEGAIRDVLDGRRGGRGRFLLFVGPAVTASIAYMDPGNFATNIQAGARYGYGLLWVVLLANLTAMLFQALSAKLGIVTGKNLAEHCRDATSRPVRLALWGISEIAAMATDLAEFLGGAIGLSLLTGMPLMAGMAVTAIITYAFLLLEHEGFRPLEIAIGAMVGTIGLCYAVELLVAPVAWGAAAKGLVTPNIPDAEALTIAVGIIGATVMPHALFLHSGLTQGRGNPRTEADRRLLVRYSNREVVVALLLAGLVNMAMVIMAAAAFHLGHSEVAEIGEAYRTLTPLLGPAAGAAFLVSLLASGISSSVVGTLAGQMVMQGFTGWRIPLLVRRLVTMLPAFVVVAIGIDPTRALVLSQVVLSLALPVPMVALVVFTRRRSVMGPFANGPLTQVAAVAGAVVVLGLNAVLLAAAFGVPVPGLG